MELRDRQQIILSDVPEDVNMSDAVYIGHVETHAIEDLLKDTTDDCPEPAFAAVPGATYEVASVLSSINPMLNDTTLHHRLNEQCKLGKFQISIGSTNVSDQKYVMDNEPPDELRYHLKRISMMIIFLINHILTQWRGAST